MKNQYAGGAVLSVVNRLLVIVGTERDRVNAGVGEGGVLRSPLPLTLHLFPFCRPCYAAIAFQNAMLFPPPRSSSLPYLCRDIRDVITGLCVRGIPRSNNGEQGLAVGFFPDGMHRITGIAVPKYVR